MIFTEIVSEDKRCLQKALNLVNFEFLGLFQLKLRIPTA